MADARPISVQLYTLREQAAADFPGVLERLGGIGYAGVEPAGLHGLSASQVRRILDGAGLQVSGAHVGLPLADDALDEQQELGNNAVIVPMINPQEFTSADGVKRAADSLNAHIDRVAGRGMTLGYHNHWFEFAPLPDGSRAYDVFVSHLDPRIELEVDIYWAQTGGCDPAAVVAELGERCTVLHVKDGPCTQKDPMVAVGRGSVDVPAVLAAAPHAKWHVVELDRCATDMFEAVEQSYRYLVDNGLSRGQS